MLTNFLKIYFWKIISVLTGFLSLIIVIPAISSNQVLFSIYMLVVSITVYFSYADIGFLSSGQKFANEEFAKKNFGEEGKILGFVLGILLIFITPFSGLLIYFSFNPSLLINNISLFEFTILSKLLLVVGIFMPIQIFLQRMMTALFAIRLLDYKLTRLEILGNLIKIASVFYFFRPNEFELVNYLLFINLVSIAIYIYALYISRKIDDLNPLLTLKSIWPTKKYYKKTKDLAFASLASTIGFIFFYELDLIIISRLLDPESIAIYAIGFTLINFVRSISAILYSPFFNRLNHYVGLNNLDKSEFMIKNLIQFTFPFYFILIALLFVFSNEIIVSWVGVDYFQSVQVFQILILTTFFNFLVIPSNLFFVGYLKTKYIYLISVLQPFIFINSIFLFHVYDKLDVNAIAFSKLSSVVLAFIVSIYGIRKFFDWGIFFRRWTTPTVIFTFLLYYVSINMDSIFNVDGKNNLQLIYLVTSLGLILISTYLTFICANSNDRNLILSKISDLRHDLKKRKFNL